MVMSHIVYNNSPTSSKVRVGGPDGGDGGQGGSVVFKVDTSVKSLRSLLSQYRGRDGSTGQGSYNQGSSGKDVIVKVMASIYIRYSTQSGKGST